MMTDEQLDDLIKQLNAHPTSDVLRDIATEKQRPTLIKLCERAITQKKTASFLSLLAYITKEYPNTPLSELDDAVIDFFREKHSKHDLITFFEHYPEEKHIPLINRLGNTLNNEALDYLAPFLHNENKRALIETLFLSDAQIESLFTYLDLLEIDVLTTLLSKLKAQDHKKIQYSKCNAINQTLLKHHIHKRERINAIFETEHAQGLISIFLLTPNSHPKPFEFLIDCLSHFKINPLNHTLQKSIERYINETLSKQNEANCIKLLTVYEKNISTSAFNEYLLRLLADSPDNIKLINNYLIQTSSLQKQNFLALNPYIDVKTTTTLLSYLDPTELAMLVIMSHTPASLETPTITHRLFKYLAEQAARSDEFPIGIVLTYLRELSDTSFSNLLSTLFEYHKTKEQKATLITLLLASVDDLNEKKALTLKHIKTALISLFTDKSNAGINIKTLFTFNFTSKDNPYPSLFDVYLEKAGKDRYFKLLTHLLMLLPTEPINDALTVFYENATLCEDFLFTSDLPDKVVENIVTHLNNDDFFALYKQLAIRLKSETQLPSNLSVLVRCIANRLNDASDDETLLSDFKSTILSDINIVTRLLTDANCFSTLTASNLGYIDIYRAKHYNSLEKRGALLIRAANGLLETEPSSLHSVIRRLAQNLLITYQRTPKTLIDRLYDLQQAANHEDGKDLKPFIDELKRALYQMLQPDKSLYDESQLTSFISKLSSETAPLKGVFNAIAIDAAKETKFDIAADQLEKLNGDITYLKLEQWDISQMPDILLQSDVSSPNWRLFEAMAKKTNAPELKQALIYKLKTLTLSKEVSEEKKDKIARFIIDNLYDKNSLTLETFATLKDIIAFIPPDYIREGKQSLFFHELIADAHKIPEIKIDSIITLLSVSISQNAPLDTDTIKHLLNYPDLTNEAALSSLLASFAGTKDSTLYLQWIEKYFEKQNPHFQKTCLSFALQKRQYNSFTPLSLLTRQFATIKQLNRYSEDYADIVNPLLNQLSIYLHQVLTSENHSDITEASSLLLTVFTHLLDNNVSWCMEIFDNDNCLRLFEVLLKASQPNTQARKYLLSLISTLPSKFTETLITHIKDESIQYDIYELMISLLTEEHYASTLEKNHYETLFKLLPIPQREHVAKTILQEDTLDDWQHEYRLMLAHSLRPTALFELYKTHDNNPLYAHFLLHHPETYDQLDGDALAAVLQSVNTNIELDKLFQTLSPTLIPKLSHAVIQYLASPDINHWFSSVNLYDDTFMRFVNGIIDIADKQIIQQLIEQQGALDSPSHFLSKIHHGLAHFDGTYTIYKDGLLSKYLRAFISNPLNLTACNETTRNKLIRNLDIKHVTEILSSNEAFLDNSLALRDIMGPFGQSGPSDDAEDKLIHSHHHVYLATARWFINLPLIIEGHITHKRQRDALTMLLSNLGTVPDAFKTWLDTHDLLLQAPFTQQTQIGKHTNQHFERLQLLLNSLSEGLEILSTEKQSQLDNVQYHLREIELSLETTLKNYKAQLEVLQKADSNLESLFSIDSHLAKITQKDGVSRFPKGHEAFWIDVLSKSHKSITDLYGAYASGVLSAIDESFKIYKESKEVNSPQKAFIQMALFSPHVVSDEKRIHEACQILEPEDLKDILNHYEFASYLSETTFPAFQRLCDYSISHFEINSIIKHLYSKDYSTVLLDDMLQVAKSASALALYNLIQFVSEAKKQKIPLLEAIEYMLSSDISEHSEDNWIYHDITKTLSLIYLQQDRYQQIYQHALSYKPHKSPENAQKTLNYLGQLEHQVMNGKHLAFLLNSYAPATHSVKGSSRIDIRYLQNALYRLTKACDYEKQIILFKHLDLNLLRDVLLASVRDLSSADIKIRREAASLIDHVTAYGLRDDIDDELKSTIRLTLSQDQFNRYSAILTPIIEDLVKYGKAPSTLTEVTPASLTKATFDGVWIQRIITSPHVISKLTPEDLKELIERYRHISQFLKKDEYNTWEDKAKTLLSELKVTLANQEAKLNRLHLSFDITRKITESQYKESKAQDALINETKRRISHIENKKRRILKFKANDSIRALLQQLQRDIHTLESSDLRSANDAQAVFSQYLELEFKEYKSSTLSNIFHFMHEKLIPEGDLAKQATILSRLADKYIPHCNFATKELLRKSLIDPIRVGAKIYNSQGEEVAVLDENNYLVSDLLSTDGDRLEEEPLLLTETKKGNVGMPLYNADHQPIGFLTAEGKYSPDNLFIAQTSLDLISHTPLNELKSIPLLTPDLLKDVIKEQQIGALYNSLFSPIIPHEEDESKQQWLLEQVKSELLKSKMTIDQASATQLVRYHEESDYDALLAHCIKHNKKSAMHLVEAYLANQEKAKTLLTSSDKKASLFHIFDKLNLSGTDILTFSTTSTFPHPFANDVRALLKLYQMKKEDTVSMQEGRRISEILFDDSSALESSPFHDTVNHLNSRLLAPSLTKSLHRDVRVEILLSPAHYPQLSQDNFNALFNALAQSDVEAIYHYFLTHNIDRLFFDQGLILFLNNDPNLFFKCLKNHSNKEAITQTLLTHPDVTQAVFQTLPKKVQLTVSDDVSLSQLFSAKSTPFHDLFSKHSFMAGIHAYVNGYNNSPELAVILSQIMTSRLDTYLKSHLSDSDIKALSSLVDDPHFKTLHQRLPLCNDLFSKLLETAGKSGVTTLFYTSTQALDVKFAQRKIHCSLLSDVYAHISETSLKDKSWRFLKQLSWENISSKTKALINRLPWVTDGKTPVLTWQDIKTHSLETLQAFGGEVKTLDLYLLQFQGDTDKLKTLLNDYCYAYYGETAAMLPDHSKLSLLYSTVALLHNEHISKSVKTALFEVLQSHPRLRDQTITEQMAYYNISGLIKYHGKRKQYDEIIQLYEDNITLRDNFPALKKAHDEARLEKQLQTMTGNTWLKSIKTWWNRIWQYGWHGFFSPNKPNFVAYHSASLEGLSLVPQPKTEIRPLLNLMSSTHGQVGQREKLQDLLIEIQNTNTPFPFQASLSMLEELEQYRSNYQTPVEDEIQTREAIHDFYLAICQHETSTYSLDSHTHTLISKAKRNAIDNRKILLELYHHAANITEAAYGEKISHLLKICQKNPELSPINKQMLEDHPKLDIFEEKTFAPEQEGLPLQMVMA